MGQRLARTSRFDFYLRIGTLERAVASLRRLPGPDIPNIVQICPQTVMIMGFHSWIHVLSIWFSIWNLASISVSISFSIWIQVSISVSGFRFQTPFGLSFLLDGMENGKRNGKSRKVQNGTEMEHTVCVSIFSILHPSKFSIWCSILFSIPKALPFRFPISFHSKRPLFPFQIPENSSIPSSFVATRRKN